MKTVDLSCVTLHPRTLTVHVHKKRRLWNQKYKILRFNNQENSRKTLNHHFVSIYGVRFRTFVLIITR